MRLLIDTNILISAALFPDSVPAKAFAKAVIPPHEAVVCDYSLDEMRRVFNRKFPHRLSDFERFVSGLTLAVERVSTPVHGESKDFLESGILKPKSLTAAEFFRA